MVLAWCKAEALGVCIYKIDSCLNAPVMLKIL